MEESPESKDPQWRFAVRCNSQLDDTISKILLVHDGLVGPDQELIEFLTLRGYHVVCLFLQDSLYTSTREFVTEFEKFVKSHRQKFVWTIVHYAQTDPTDVCMYCHERVPKHSLLLKQVITVVFDPRR
jgi:hypothetical protein